MTSPEDVTPRRRGPRKALPAADIIQAYRDGVTVAELADQYGVVPNTIYARLRAAEIVRQRRTVRDLTAEGRRALVRKYRAGATLRDLAASYGLSYGLIHRFLSQELARHGETLRHRGQRGTGTRPLDPVPTTEEPNGTP